MAAFRSLLMLTSFVLIGCAAFALSGCKKGSEAGGSGGEVAEMAIAPMDLKPDGSLKPEGIQKIDELSGKGPFNLIFVRTRLSDAGLGQLAKYQGLRRVQAIGSDLSARAIDKLKKAVPESEVITK